MTTEYIAKIKGDTSQLEQVLKKVQGKMKKLEDDEVLIKLDYDGNVKQFNKVFDQVLKTCPDLTIQFQYDANKKLLDKEIKKLETLEEIKVGIDGKDFSKNIDNKIKEIKNSVSNNDSSDSISQQIKDLFKYANTAKELGAKIGRDLSEKLAEALMDTKAEDILDDILDKVDVSKLSLFKVTGNIDEEISKAKENVKDLNEYMNLLISKGASKNGKGSTELEALQEEVKILKSDLSDMKDELQNISGEQFDQMTQSVKETTDQLNLALEKIKEIQQTLNANDMGIKLTDVVNTWRQEKESKSRERYTAFNSESLSTSGVHIAAEADGVGEKLIREAISEMGGKATGFIHSHPNKKAAFSDTDIEAYYKLASEGITEQIVTSFNESMSLNMDNVDLNKSDEVIKIIQKKYKEIDDKWLNNLELSTEEIKEKVTPLLNAKTDDPVFNAVIRTIRDNFDDLMDGITNLDEFSEVMEENADYILKQIPQFREKSVAERNEIITKVAGFSDLLHDAVLGGVVENLQGEYQKILLDVFTDKRFLKEGAESAIKVMPIAEFLDAKSIADVIEESVKIAEKATEKAQDSSSPSKVAEKLGEYWGIGYANGIKKHKSDVEDAVRELVETGILTAEDLQKGLDTILSGGFGKKYKDLIIPLKNILNENSSNSYENKSLRELLELYHQIGINNDSDEELNKISEALFNIIQSQKELNPSQLQKFIDVLRGLRTKEEDFIPIINEIYSVENAIKILERLQGVNKTSPTQQFDNDIQQNLVMLENYKNTINEINRIKLDPETDETKRKIEELNKLADYFASKITTIRSENGHEINKSMMYFVGVANPNLREHYTSEQIKEFDKVATERSGLNIDTVSNEFIGIDKEIQEIENKSEALRQSLNKSLSDSRDFVDKIKRNFTDLVDTDLELKVEINKKDIELYKKDIEEILRKYPELQQFLGKFTSWKSAAEFTKSDEWNDFLATFPQAHDYLEAIGYDFEKINRPIENTEERIITLKVEEQQAEATAQAEKKVVEARQEASITKSTTGSTTTESDASSTTTLSSPILSEEQLQKELAKVREIIDKEKGIIKELEDELSIEVPNAIQKKNEEFDEEVKKVREDVDKEKAILSELKEYLDTTIPEAINVKNSKFNEEVGKVKQAIDEEIGHLDRFRSKLEKPISIDIQKDNEDTFDDSYAFSEAMDRFAKKQQAQYQRKLDNLSALTSELKAKNDERDQDKEIQGVSKLDQALTEVIEKINLKITAFSREEDRVKEISANEAEALNQIVLKLERIQTLAQTMKSAFQGLKIDGQFDVKGISNLLKFENADFFKATDSLQKLCDALSNLKLGKNSFVNQLEGILAKGKELENLVKILNASEKKITQAKEDIKTDKEKNRENSYKKELELEKQKLALEKEYQLLEAKGDSKAEEIKAKNLIKINQLEKERKQIVDSRKKGETSKDLRNQINSEIKAIRERNEADIQAEKAAKEIHDQKQRRADKEKAWNTAEKKFNDEKAKAAKEAAEAEAKATKEAEKARAEAEKKASQEAKNAERIRKESLEESYGMQKALMKEASDLAIRNLALSDSESEFDIKEVANNNERIAEIGKQINDIVEKRNKLDSDSITLHRELLNYQEELNRDYQTQFDLRDRNKATEHNENAIAGYKELIKTANEYYDLQINTFGKDDNNPDVIRLNELINKWEQARKAKQEYNDFSINKEGSNKSIQELKEVEEQFANIEAQVSAEIREGLVKELPKYIKLDKENKYIDEFSDKVKEVIRLINQINDIGLDLSNAEDIENIRKIRDLMADINSDKGLAQYKEASESRIKQLQLQIRQFQNNNSAMGKAFSEQFDDLFNQFGMARSIEEVNRLKSEFASLEAEVVKAGKTGKNFFVTFVERLKSINAHLIATYLSFQDIIRYIRIVATTIRDVDSALTELRKVSNASTERLSQDFVKSAQTAKELGSSIIDVINITSDWARLGYNVDEAEELARVTTLFQTVGDNMTTESASEAMISTMKAYGLSVDYSSRIVDQYNEVANNFAIDTAGLADSITRAGAALSAGGNDLAESMGLVVAANDSLQDPSSVGQMLKTMSMRLRGASAADLEELGIDTEGMTQGTKSIVQQYKAMAGIDIMEGTDYKTTYQILSELHDKWADLSDAERAAITEATGGKRGGSVMSSLMNNWEDAEAVVAKAEASTGSAMREQENYARSIQFSLDRLNASWQELQTDLISSSAIKDIVDIANGLLGIIDQIVKKVDGIIPILTTIGGMIAAHKGVDFLGGMLTVINDAKDGLVSAGDVLKTTIQSVSENLKSSLNNLTTNMANDMFIQTPEGLASTVNLQPEYQVIFDEANRAAQEQEHFNLKLEEASEILRRQRDGYVEVNDDTLNQMQGIVDYDEERTEALNNILHFTEQANDALDEQASIYEEIYDYATSGMEEDSSESIQDTIDAYNERQEALQSVIEAINSETIAETENATAQATNTQQTVQGTSADTAATAAINEKTMAERAEINTILQENIAKAGASAASQQQILTTMEEIAGDEGLTMAKLELISTMSVEELTQRGLTVAQAQATIQTAQQTLEQYKLAHASKAVVLATNLAKLAVGGLIGILGGMILNKVLSWIDDFIYREQKMADAAKQAKEAINDINQSFQDSKKTTNDIKQRYAELAQGVANLGTAFQSQGNLSTDEYEEFLDLSNQLSELYPTLTTGYTENGDALIGLSGSVNEMVKSLDAMIERSEQIARSDIADKMEDVWKDDTNKINNLVNELEGYEEYRLTGSDPSSSRWIAERVAGYKDQLEAYENLYTYVNENPIKLFNEDVIKDLAGNVDTNSVFGFLEDALREVNSDKAFILNDNYSSNKDISLGFLTDSELEKLSLELQKQINNYRDLTAKAESDIAQINSEFQSNLVTYLGSSTAFKQLDDTQQKIAYDIFNQFDITQIDTDEITSFEDLGDWYTNNIINQLAKIDDKQIQEKLSQVLSGALSIGDLSATYQDIIDYLTRPISEGGLGLSKTEGGSGYELVFELQTRLDTVADERNALMGHLLGDNWEWLDEDTKDFFFNFVNSLDKAQRTKLFEANIDTQGLVHAEDKIEYFKKLLEDIPSEKEVEVKATISDSIKQLATQVDPYFDEIGSFYQKIFDIVDGNNVQNDIYNPENFAKLDNDTLNSLRSTFEEISEEVGVAFDPSIVDDFWHKLESATNSEEAHAAIDSLVTQWLDATDTIKNINDDTANYIKVQLSNWGIINADEVVQSRLELNNADKESADIMKEITPLYEELQQEKENLNSANIAEREQAKARIPLIEQEILERYKEVEATEATRISLFQLALLEEGISLNNINSATDVQQILAIAQACGITSKALSALQNFENNIATLGANGMDTNAMNGMRQKYINQFAEELDPSNLMKDAKADWTEAAKDAGSSAGKEAVDAYQEQLDVLTWLYENDVIDSKHYLDQKGLLIKHMWENGTLDAKRYFELTHDWLREMLDLYNSAISYITKQLDKEIDKLEEERDKRLEEIEKEKDAAIEAVDSEIDAVDKLIKKKQEVIDELEKENERRKESMALQRAEFELQRSLHQKTNLVKILPNFVVIR